MPYKMQSGRTDNNGGLPTENSATRPGLFAVPTPLELLLEDGLATGFELVGGPFQEQHPEDVFLELRGVHLAPEDVSGRKEMPF